MNISKQILKKKNKKILKVFRMNGANNTFSDFYSVDPSSGLVLLSSNAQNAINTTECDFVMLHISVKKTKNGK